MSDITLISQVKAQYGFYSRN